MKSMLLAIILWITLFLSLRTMANCENWCANCDDYNECEEWCANYACIGPRCGDENYYECRETCEMKHCY